MRIWKVLERQGLSSVACPLFRTQELTTLTLIPLVLQDNSEMNNTLGDAEDLKSKIAALTSALSTVSSEKKRIETSFQNDKKRLLAEKEKVYAFLLLILMLTISIIIITNIDIFS